LVWGGGVTLLGYWLGSRIPNVERYLLPIILVAMAISFGPTIYHLVKSVLQKSKI
jgi:membrane-associated protein